MLEYYVIQRQTKSIFLWKWNNWRLRKNIWLVYFTIIVNNVPVLWTIKHAMDKTTLLITSFTTNCNLLFQSHWSWPSSKLVEKPFFSVNPKSRLRRRNVDLALIVHTAGFRTFHCVTTIPERRWIDAPHPFKFFSYSK